MSEDGAGRLRAPSPCAPLPPNVAHGPSLYSISGWIAAQEPCGVDGEPLPTTGNSGTNQAAAGGGSRLKAEPRPASPVRLVPDAIPAAQVSPGLIRRLKASSQRVYSICKEKSNKAVTGPGPKTLTAEGVLAAAGTSTASNAFAICCASQGIIDLGCASDWEPFDRLTAIDLSDNRLTGIEALAQLPALQNLNVSGNKLQQLWGPRHSGSTAAAAVAGSTGGAASTRASVAGAAATGLSPARASLAASPVPSSGGAAVSSRRVSAAGVPSSISCGGSTVAAAAAAGGGASVRTSVAGGSSCRPSAAGGVQDVAASGGRASVRPSVAGASSTCRPSAAGATSEAAAAAAAAAGLGGPSLEPDPGFQALTWLDLSYNSLSAEQLLSASSPVSHLPALKHLAAAGCGLQQLPDHLGPFLTLSSLDLSHNGLRSAALVPLGSLPALKMLQLAGNALSSIPPPAVTGAGAFPALQMLGLAATKVREVAAVAAGLAALPELQRVWLGATPLSSLGAKRQALQQALAGSSCQVCWSNPVVLTLEEPAAASSSSNTAAAAAGGAASSCSSPKKGSGAEPNFRVPAASVGVAAKLQGQRVGLATLPTGVFVQPDAVGSTVLTAAAARLAAPVHQLPHEVLVNIFDRVDQDIAEWKLASIAEEASVCSEGSVSSSRDGGSRFKQQKGRSKAGGQVDQQEDITDHTFLTGVGIVEDGEEDGQVQGPMYGPHLPQDPTERLAVLLGLNPLLLAHHTGRVTGDTSAALANLKFALAYPLVDPDTGLSPAPHHTATTASILAKQRPKAPATSVGAPFGTTSGYATGGTSVTGGYAMLGAGATIAAAGSVGGGSTTSPMCRATVVANARRTSDVGVMAAAAAAAACQAEAVTGLSAALQTRVVPVVALQDLLAGMKARLQVLEGSLLQQLQEQADRMTSSYEEVSAAIAAAPDAPAAAN